MGFDSPSGVLDRQRLYRSWLCFPGGGNVGGGIFECSARFISPLLVCRSHFANGIMPAIIPTDAGFSVHHGPRSMWRANRLSGFAVTFEGDIESCANSLAHLPPGDEIVAARHCGRRGDFN